MELRLQKEFQPNIGALVAYIARTGNGCNLSCHVFVKTICPEFTQRCIYSLDSVAPRRSCSLLFRFSEKATNSNKTKRTIAPNFYGFLRKPELYVGLLLRAGGFSELSRA